MEQGSFLAIVQVAELPVQPKEKFLVMIDAATSMRYALRDVVRVLNALVEPKDRDLEGPHRFKNPLIESLEIITFNSEGAETIVTPRSTAREMYDALSVIKVGGGTNYKLGFAELQRRLWERESKTPPIVVLFSNGTDDPYHYLDQTFQSLNIILYVIGIDPTDPSYLVSAPLSPLSHLICVLQSKLAKSHGGQFAAGNYAHEVAAIFNSVVAHSAKLSFFGPRISIGKGKENSVHLNNMSHGATVRVVLDNVQEFPVLKGRTRDGRPLVIEGEFTRGEVEGMRTACKLPEKVSAAIQDGLGSAECDRFEDANHTIASARQELDEARAMYPAAVGPIADRLSRALTVAQHELTSPSLFPKNKGRWGYSVSLSVESSDADLCGDDSQSSPKGSPKGSLKESGKSKPRETSGGSGGRGSGAASDTEEPAPKRIRESRLL